ncbi:MAG TPA: signal peptidase II, partial [Candidatus Krumholzibacteria bacterium]|nr:signal peptidase II [Candidatus Krumholzibacteria bacterium]
GNLVDRLFYGGRVVDFIEMSWRGHVFPVYNFADMGVSIGAVILILALLMDKEEEPPPALQEQEPPAHEE